MSSCNQNSSQLKDFEVIKTLGEGSFAKVYKVVRRSDGQSYAMKRCKIGLMKQRDKENALNEVRILASIKNPYVIAYKEAIYEEQQECLYVIMEYAAGGDLHQQVKNSIKSRTYIDENQIWIWTVQMLYGLKGLHDLKILHRDLKCANIFLDSRRNVKIGDLNVSKITQANLARTQVGTPYYTSPEVWKDQMYNNKSDIWSLGCLIYELSAQKPPFTATDMPSLFKKIGKGIYERIPSKYSNELSYVIGQCLNINQHQRLDCEQLLQLPIVRKKIEDLNIKFENYIQKEDGLLSNNNQKSSVIDLIKYPSNKRNLQERLPKPSYNTNSQQEIKKIAPSNQGYNNNQILTSEEYKNMRRVRSNSGIQLKQQNSQIGQPYQRFDILLEQEIQRRLESLNMKSRNYTSQPSSQQLVLPPRNNSIEIRRRMISEDIKNFQSRLEADKENSNNNYNNNNSHSNRLKQYENHKRRDIHSFYEAPRKEDENNYSYSNRYIPKNSNSNKLLSEFNNPYTSSNNIAKNYHSILNKPYSLRNDIPLPLPHSSSSHHSKELTYFGPKRVQTEVRSVISRQYR